MQSPLEQKKQMIEQLRRLGGVGEQRRIIEYAQAPFVAPDVRRRLAGGVRPPTVSGPTYSLIATAASVNEGGTVTFILTTTGVADGTSVPFTITGINGTDISGSPLTGSFTVSSGTAAASYNVANDATTEGSETITLTLDSIVPATSTSVTINDTSVGVITSTGRGTLSTSAASVNEGSSFTITLTLSSAPPSTTYAPYTITGVESADINSASLTGNFILNPGSNTASVVFTATEDFFTEGAQTFTLTLDLSGTDIQVIINDTSLTPTTIEEIFGGETTGGVVTVLETQFDASVSANFIPGNPGDGDTFTQWTDSNAGTKNANPIGGATTRASYQSGTGDLQNSLAVVRFDGSDGLSINPYPGLASKSGITVFMISKMSAETGSVNNLDPRVFSTNVANGIALYYNSTSNRWTVAASSGVAESTQTNNASAFNIHTLVYDGSATGNANRLRYLYNGVQDTLTFTGTVGTATSASIDTLYIGNNNGSNFFTGDMAEFLIFTRTLTANEIQGVLNYLENKWGL